MGRGANECHRGGESCGSYRRRACDGDRGCVLPDLDSAISTPLVSERSLARQRAFLQFVLLVTIFVKLCHSGAKPTSGIPPHGPTDRLRNLSTLSSGMSTFRK